MRALAIYQLKGGVGKTTTAVNLAALAASENIPTLLWDLDPQASASWLLHAKSNESQIKLWQQEAPLHRFIQSSPIPKLDVLAADLSLRKLSSVIARKKDARDAMTRWLSQLGEQYGLVIIDCPPLLAPVMEGILRAVDRIALPVEPSGLSLRTYQQLREHCDWVPKEHWLPFVTMVDRRKPAHVAWIQQQLPNMKEFLRTYIGYSASAERMLSLRAPIVSEQPSVAMARNYVALWQALKPKLKLR